MTADDLFNRFANYLGAHQVPDRQPHEMDRAIQRFYFNLLVLCIGWPIGDKLNLLHHQVTHPFILCSVAYGLMGVVFYYFIKNHPHGGVRLQYLFLVADPFWAVGLIALEPAAFSWFAVILIVIVTRTGVRYGMRTMMLSWISAFIWAFVWFFATRDEVRWDQNFEAYLVVIASLVIAIPLFIPVIRLQAKSREFESQRIKIEALSQQLKARSEFLSKVSHELKTPLQSIVSTLDLLEIREGRPRQPELVLLMRRAADSLSTQLADLLTLARGEAGSLTITPKHVDILEVFYQVVGSTKQAAKLKGLHLTLEAPEEWPTVVVDGVRLAQVAENLITNAIKYTESGDVIVELEPYDHNKKLIRFSVSDTGLGIDQKDIERIFRTYATAGAHVGDVDSSGVGLAVVRTVLAYLGGSIDVESRLGHGSKFSVTVPAEIPEPATAPRSRPLALVVDARESDVVTLDSMLRALQLDAHTVSTIGQAANALAVRRYDLIIVDINLPMRSGAEVVRDTRNGAGPNKHSKFVAITSSDDPPHTTPWPFDGEIHRPLSGRKVKEVVSRLR